MVQKTGLETAVCQTCAQPQPPPTQGCRDAEGSSRPCNLPWVQMQMQRGFASLCRAVRSLHDGL